MNVIEKVIRFFSWYKRKQVEKLLAECEIKRVIVLTNGLIINVYVSDRITEMNGCDRRFPGAFSGKNGGMTFICMNRMLSDCDRWMIEPMIRHEIGHLMMHGEVEATMNWLRVFGKEWLMIENEADAYAQQSHDMMNVLLWLKNYGMDVDRRIVALSAVCVESTEFVA